MRGCGYARLNMSDTDDYVSTGSSETQPRGNGLLHSGEEKKGKCFPEAFQGFVAWTFLFLVVAMFVLLVLMKVISPYFLASKNDATWGSLLADNRCKCVCPHNLNITRTFKTTVWMEVVDNPSECVCEAVLPIADESLCLWCTCSYESRNRVLIAVIIAMFLLLSFLLFLYAMFVCLQPIIFRNSRPTIDQYTLLGRDHQANTGLYNIRLRLQQMRWRQTVAEERLTESHH